MSVGSSDMQRGSEVDQSINLFTVVVLLICTSVLKNTTLLEIRQLERKRDVRIPFPHHRAG